MKPDWKRFQSSPEYRMEILQALLSTPAGRSALSELVSDLHQDFNGLSFTDRMNFYSLHYQLKAWQNIQAAPPALYGVSIHDLSGVDWKGVVKWTGVAALTAVAGYGLLRIAPAVLGTVAQGVGMAAGVLLRGGSVVASSIPALWTWATASGWRALGVSLAVLFSSEWAYSKIIGKRSLFEKALEKTGEIVKAAPAAIKSGMLLAIALFGVVAIYNITRKD